MWKRWLFRTILGVILLIAAGIFSLPWWFSPAQIEQLANRFLAPNYSIHLPKQWVLHPTGLQLAGFQLKSPQCTLADFQKIELNWWKLRHLNIENAVLDYDCLRQLPTDDQNKTSVNLTALLSSIPTSEFSIAHLQIKNTESITQRQLQSLFNSDIAANVRYDGGQLALALQGKAQSAVIFQHNSYLKPQNGQFLWQGQTDYQPTEQQDYHLQFSTELNNDLMALPQQGELKLDWNNAALPVKKGNAQLSWNGEEGQINAQDLVRNQPLLDVPVTFTPNGLEITWGKLYWTFDGYQPIKGFLGLNIQKPENAWLPLKTDLNIILQTFGKYGKGEIVISGKNGEIGGGEKLDSLKFDLKTIGDLRYNDNVAHTNLEYKVRGTFSEPWGIFSKGSLFKMDNIQPDSKVHLRLPLDDVIVGRYGLEGRLQATLQGNTPQFDALDLKLDGYGHEFIAGVKTVFDLRDEQQKLRSAEMRAANRWDWDIQGNMIWKALKTPVKINGVGFWQDDHIELNQLTVTSGNIHTAGVKMAPLSLQLKDRLRWDYVAEKIRGLAQAKTDWIEFDYGGRFVHPVFGVGIDGKSINNFNAAGALTAGTLGPLDVFAHYENQALTGNIAWKEQSADVFQTLFPQKWDWVIHQGSIKGATNFAINEKGVSMDGALTVSNGRISLPDGEIEGIKIHFPLHYHDFSLQANANDKIEFYADDIRMGALTMQRAKFNVHGNYPNNARKPLILSNVNVDLFDGNLSVDELRFPQKNAAVLNLQRIDLAKVLQMAQYNQIYMRGRVNARLPFWLNHKACLICHGSITQAGPLNIKLDEKVVKGLKAGGWTESILVDVIKNMNLNSFNAQLDLMPTGEMALAATVIGYNPDKKTHNPITLNYTHKENMFELWNMIDYGSQFEQNLEYRLYQRAEQ
ncbi:dicarboxylate transport [Pasteurella langaaensis DSM 22999]|uniref:Dicarboxylate transport n=1 Tax=Alitibacter langaaensis DSM 22999 TaxID=1122935 RepID=A0A2U0SM30_9PAST|nr:YdbH family protein [Pasteurella langaaensis]PVX32390.1 dicarboxylate transport [Pasteurella langaaensis DSM 22999]